MVTLPEEGLNPKTPRPWRNTLHEGKFKFYDYDNRRLDDETNKANPFTSTGIIPREFFLAFLCDFIRDSSVCYLTASSSSSLILASEEISSSAAVAGRRRRRRRRDSLVKKTPSSMPTRVSKQIVCQQTLPRRQKIGFNPCFSCSDSGVVTGLVTIFLIRKKNHAVQLRYCSFLI